MTPGTPGTAAWSWLDDTALGPVAFLLLVPPPPEAETLAAALGLVEPGARLPDIGDRVALLGPDRVALDGIEVPVGRRWASFVAGGGPVAVLVGLEPLAGDAGRGSVEAYVAANTLARRLRLGVSPGPTAGPGTTAAAAAR
jgi:hypothetical protein